MFQGFSDATVDFMWGIRFNNERTWFNAHKEEFITHFQTPMRALATEVYDRMTEAHPKLELTYKVSRIYRDARRLFGRGPYRDCLWFSIHPYTENEGAVPVFWFELSPEDASWGLGFWEAKALTMAKFRARINRDPKAMEKLARALNKQSTFTLEGPEYKRPQGTPPSDLLAPWYRKKSVHLIHSEPISSALYSHELVDRLCADFEFLMPFYRYLSTIDGDPDPRDT